MRKTIPLAGIVALLAYFGCNTDHPQSHETDSKIMVTSPMRMDTSVTSEYVCQIKAIQHIELRALEEGYLQGIYVDEGELVEKGQLLFQVMPTIYEAELQKAQAEAGIAQIGYQNTKALADSNIVSQNELALAKAEWDRANAELALAEAHMKFTEIRAPFAGLMGHFHVRLGSLLEEGELLTELSDIRNLWVYFNVPEAEYLDYKIGVKKDSLLDVRLRMANNQVFDQTGVVTTIEADFDNSTGNIAFRATFPNPDGLLRHGETGNILVKTPLKDALIIPQKATFEILDRKYVFVVDEKNVVHQRQITIGEELPHLYVVREGLDQGDKVLLEGLRKVKDQDKIHFIYQEPDSVLTHLDLYAE